PRGVEGGRAAPFIELPVAQRPAAGNRRRRGGRRGGGRRRRRGVGHGRGRGRGERVEGRVRGDGQVAGGVLGPDAIVVEVAGREARERLRVGRDQGGRQRGGDAVGGRGAALHLRIARLVRRPDDHGADGGHGSHPDRREDRRREVEAGGVEAEDLLVGARAVVEADLGEAAGEGRLG